MELDRSVLARWVGEASKLVDPLVEALRRCVMSTDCRVIYWCDSQGAGRLHEVWIEERKGFVDEEGRMDLQRGFHYCRRECFSMVLTYSG